MKLETLERHWNEFGRVDPMWAIMTDGTKAGNRWDAGEFFARGERTVRRVMHRADALGLPEHRGRALDFGCGLGRLTQALAERFAEADGVDIASTMVEGARAHNRHGDRVRYHVNTANDLGLFAYDTFDLVLSYIVLQHVHPRYAIGYLLELYRVLRPGGLLVFQLPSHVPPTPALPDAAYDAEIRPRAGSLEAVAGEKLTVAATVRNASPEPWPFETDARRTLLSLGNHWLDAGGRTTAFDDGRIALPGLGPGEAVTLELTVTAPSAPGTYALELDLVHEGVCWFAQRNSAPARIAVRVAAAAGRGEEPAEPFVPVMEVHGIRRPVVEGILEACGAGLVAVDPDAAAGAWQSWTYFVTKPA